MYLIYDDDPTHCARLRTLLLSDPNNTEQDIRTASTEADAIRQLSGDTPYCSRISDWSTMKTASALPNTSNGTILCA